MVNKRIYLCLAHVSGNEQKYIQEAFDTINESFRYHKATQYF